MYFRRLPLAGFESLAVSKYTQGYLDPRDVAWYFEFYKSLEKSQIFIRQLPLTGFAHGLEICLWVSGSWRISFMVGRLLCLEIYLTVSSS